MDIGMPIPQTGNLTPWAKQGVLLLNAYLTVQAQTHLQSFPIRLGRIYQYRNTKIFRSEREPRISALGEICAGKTSC